MQDAKLDKKRQEIEQLRAKGAEADTTMRRLMMQNRQLEQEKKKLMDKSEKERMEEQLQRIIDTLKSKLSQQSDAMEEKNKALKKAIEEKEHLEQKALPPCSSVF